MVFPYILSNYAVSKGRELVGFHVLIENELGVLDEVIDVFRDHNVKPYSLTVSVADPLANIAVFYVIADLGGKMGLVKRIKEDITALERVKEVKVVEPMPEEVIVNEHLYPLVMADKEGIFLGKDELLGLLVESRKAFGYESISAILYHIGYTSGRPLGKLFLQEIGTTEPARALNFLLRRVCAMSLMRGEIASTSRNNIRVRVLDQWECRVLKGHVVDKATSHFTRGYIAGFLDAVLGEEGKVKVVESKCINLGDKYCELLILW